MLAQAQEFISGNIPLVAYTRGGLIEAVNRGAYAIVASDGEVLHSGGSISYPVTFRSCIKPFQLIAVLTTGADKRYGFSDQELALAAASHSGEKLHLEATASLLGKLGLSEAALRCGFHKPIDSEIALELGKDKIFPSPISNNCSGKHSSMLAACLQMGWSIENYEAREHPLQLLNEEVTAEFSNLEVPLPVAIDGCSVPTFAMPLFNGALAYARLSEPQTAPEKYVEFAERVFSIMNQNPEYVSGTRNRLENTLMRTFPGKLVAKVGAEACYTVGIAPGVVDERGVGIAIKMEDGISFNRSVDAAIVAILIKLGVIDDTAKKEFEAFFPEKIRDNRGNAVGSIEVLFDLH
jgi:L-asparaginase II